MSLELDSVSRDRFVEAPAFDCRPIHFALAPYGPSCNDVVVLAPSDQDLQHSLGRFAAECGAAGMRISTSKFEAMVLSRKRVACSLQVGGEFLPQVEEFKYLGVLFTSEGRMEREMDRRIGAASAVKRSLYWSVVVKKELSRKAKLSTYRSIYVPTLTYGHKHLSTEASAIEDAEKGIASTVMGIYTIRGDGSTKPDDVGILIEGIKILSNLDCGILAFIMLNGLIYALDLNFPDNLKNTFEFIKKILMNMDGHKLTTKIHKIKLFEDICMN